MVRAEQTDGRQPRTWPSGDRTPAEAVVGRIQDRIFRAAKIKRPRLEPHDEQSACPVLRGLGSGNGARLPDGGRHPPAAVVVPPRATAVPSQTAESAPTQRDRHLQHIADHGRRPWQRASGYTKRARAEAAIGRWKQVIGDRLRAHTDERRATELNVAVHALNRMLELGSPRYVRIA